MNCTELYLKKRKEQVMRVETIFQRADISAPALINPADTTEKRKDFPKICVSTFSDNIIRKFASLENVHQIAELYMQTAQCQSIRSAIEILISHFSSQE